MSPLTSLAVLRSFQNLFKNRYKDKKVESRFQHSSRDSNESALTPHLEQELA